MQTHRSNAITNQAVRTANGKAPSRTDQLARVLAEEILSGRHPVGAMLPSEAELVDDHGASLAAVRGALRMLGTLGLTQRGKGGAAQVVSGEVRAIYEVGASAGGAYQSATGIEIDRRRRVMADAELAVLLEVKEGSEWTHLTGLRLPADPSFGPLSWLDAWVVGTARPLPEAVDLSPESLEALCGGTVAEVREDLSAAPLTPAQARRLHARGGGYALHIMRRFLRGNGSLMAAVLDVHPAGRVLVQTRARRDA